MCAKARSQMMIVKCSSTTASTASVCIPTQDTLASHKNRATVHIASNEKIMDIRPEKIRILGPGADG